MRDEIYAAASNVELSFEIAKANQTISFPPVENKTFGDPPFIVRATSSSGLSTVLKAISGPATLAENVVTVTGAGTVTLRATQSGDTNFNPASDIDQVFDVAKANQTITFDSIADRILDEVSVELTARASSGLPVSFGVMSGPAKLEGLTLMLTGIGSVVVRAWQKGDGDFNAAPDIEMSFNVLGSRFSEMKLSEPAEFSFVFAGEIGRTYRLEASSELSIWTTIETRVNSTGAMQFRDSNIFQSKRRFYRVVSQ
jgi:hypothetical protein